MDFLLVAVQSCGLFNSLPRNSTGKEKWHDHKDKYVHQWNYKIIPHFFILNEDTITGTLLIMVNQLKLCINKINIPDFISTSCEQIMTCTREWESMKNLLANNQNVLALMKICIV